MTALDHDAVMLAAASETRAALAECERLRAELALALSREHGPCDQMRLAEARTYAGQLRSEKAALQAELEQDRAQLALAMVWGRNACGHIDFKHQAWVAAEREVRRTHYRYLLRLSVLKAQCDEAREVLTHHDDAAVARVLAATVHRPDRIPTPPGCDRCPRRV